MKKKVKYVNDVTLSVKVGDGLIQQYWIRKLTKKKYSELVDKFWEFVDTIESK